MSDEAINIINYDAKPGDFVALRFHKWGFWYDGIWSVLLLDLGPIAKQKHHRWAVSVGAGNLYSKPPWNKPHFIKGIFDGQVMKDHLMDRVMGNGRLEDVLKVRENLDEWVGKAQEWLKTQKEYT